MKAAISNDHEVQHMVLHNTILTVFYK